MSTYAEGGWDYPPGVTGNEPELSGVWPCPECRTTTEPCEHCDSDLCPRCHHHDDEDTIHA